ncbi:MAG: class I mannose-6-phosphate isomerase, partial [Chloroflexi bacterium]|nr:class I mannose-6-phosphate isomerase [Chloroflexota bacterium]
MTRPTLAESAIAAISVGLPLRPIPAPSIRPWAGHRLGTPTDHVGELWLAGPDTLVETAPGDLASLDEIAAAAGAAFVGSAALRLLGPRFPLIVKLIDAAERLSLQVHPSDELAAELYGVDALGKTEAWLVLDADPGAELITGPAPDLSEAELRAAVATGTLGHNDCEVRPATPGDTLLIETGTLHAIGAG